MNRKLREPEVETGSDVLQAGSSASVAPVTLRLFNVDLQIPRVTIVRNIANPPNDLGGYVTRRRAAGCVGRYVPGLRSNHCPCNRSAVHVSYSARSTFDVMCVPPIATQAKILGTRVSLPDSCCTCSCARSWHRTGKQEKQC